MSIFGEGDTEGIEKEKLFMFLFSFFTILLSVMRFPPVSAHLGADISSGWATTVPTMDITSGEWTDATVCDFIFEMRSRARYLDDDKVWDATSGTWTFK